MKRILLSIAMLLPVLGTGAQMQALFGYATFYLSDKQQPYIETYLQFDAWTMHFDEVAPGAYRADAEVTIVLSQQDSVCYAKKYDLASPTVASLDKLDFSFLDVQRFSVRNGLYDLRIALRDKGSDAPEAVVEDKLFINYDPRQPMLSTLQIMAGAKPTQQENILSRGGYDMEPYVSDFLPEQVDKLNFYYEVYHIEREIGSQPFLTMAYIEDQETGRRIGDMQTMSRKNAAPTVPVYGTIDIAQLPSGNYNLVVELHNRSNQTLLYKKVSFYRSNPGVKGDEVSELATTFAASYNDEAQLDIYLSGLYPIASPMENSIVSQLVKRPSLEEKQAFLYNFWKVRNALNPEGEWLKYKARIDYVQAHFSYPRTQGINTDRGRVYLQYGPPDFIRDEKNFVSANSIVTSGDQSAALSHLGNTAETTVQNTAGKAQGHVFYLPYQLWRYNKLETDNPNRVFLFWDEHRSGFYTLLNSNARGEVQDPGWERRLSRDQLPEGFDGEVGAQFNRGY